MRPVLREARRSGRNRQSDKTGISGSMPNALSCFLVVGGLGIEDVRHKRLRGWPSLSDALRLADGSAFSDGFAFQGGPSSRVSRVGISAPPLNFLSGFDLLSSPSHWIGTSSLHCRSGFRSRLCGSRRKPKAKPGLRLGGPAPTAIVGGRVHTPPGWNWVLIFDWGSGKIHGQTGPPPRGTGPYGGSKLSRYLH